MLYVLWKVASVNSQAGIVKAARAADGIIEQPQYEGAAAVQSNHRDSA